MVETAAVCWLDMVELTYENRRTNRHEKNWSNNLPKEHNYTNIKKHKNCNLLYITLFFFYFRPNEGSWLRLCSARKIRHRSRFTQSQSFWILLEHKIDRSRRDFYSPSSSIWLICFIRVWSFYWSSLDFYVRRVKKK